MKKELKLTKEQITYIDDYLKHHKVKYWDIRIELLDHIVTTVEEKLTETPIEESDCKDKTIEIVSLL